MSTSISLRLPDNVAARLKELAKENCRSISETVMWMLKKYDEESLDAYMERELPYIEQALKQQPIPTTVEDLFHE